MTDALCHLVVNGNDVLKFKLVRSIEDFENDETTFGPEMCHQVFGEKENIFGYTDLQIKLYYSAGSLLTYLGIEYADKIEPERHEGLKADDVLGAMTKVLAPRFLTNLDQFLSKLSLDSTFVPYGRLIHSFNFMPRDGGKKRTFEIYYCETSTPGFLSYHERLQTFLMWYVDAACFIDVDDDMWTFFVVYEKYETSEGDIHYATVGYATVYRYYAYPRNTRPRVSQVLVLPPFQRMGICAEMLQAIYSHFMLDTRVVDMTVEDPSVDFRRVRDYVDCKNCLTLPAFQPDMLLKGYTAEMASQAQAKFKINKKQVQRVYEILRLKAINTLDRAAYKDYRLAVKNRLNIPYQKKKLELKKLIRVLNADEYAAATSSIGVAETQDRLALEFRSLETQYKLVIRRLEHD